VLAIALCSAGIWIPGLRPVGMATADTVIVGVLCGAVVAQAHKIGLQSILGRDARLGTGVQQGGPGVAAQAVMPLPQPVVVAQIVGTPPPKDGGAA
jgi:hypothetical protein